MNPWVIDGVLSVRLKHTSRGGQTLGSLGRSLWKASFGRLVPQDQPSERGCHNFMYNSRILEFYWIFQIQGCALAYPVEIALFWSPQGMWPLQLEFQTGSALIGLNEFHLKIILWTVLWLVFKIVQHLLHTSYVLDIKLGARNTNVFKSWTLPWRVSLFFLLYTEQGHGWSLLGHFRGLWKYIKVK